MKQGLLNDLFLVFVMGLDSFSAGGSCAAGMSVARGHSTNRISLLLQDGEFYGVIKTMNEWINTTDRSRNKIMRHLSHPLIEKE